ncbi:DUF1573 domain-containing protein [Cellulophaga baltica]|uniref:DUF1573 domain-containing protein n=1 Tax=Cellulophaga baltica TaxID=76594 RepID=UPI0003FECA0A|nr:DUF1573 domain-containing protein [Cellulophaga baltica]
MKKVLLFTSLCFATLVASAQDLITKVPKNASVVIALKGKNITNLVSISEFENSKMGKMFIKQLSRKTDGAVVDLETLGINLSENFYYFMETQEGVFTHNFLVPLNDKRGFFSLLSEHQKEGVQYDGDFAYIVDDYDNMVTMWNNNTLLFTVSQEETDYDDVYGYDDYDYDYAEDAAVAVEEAVDAAEATYPILSFDQTTYNFGTIKEGDIVEHTFNFVNTGSSSLVISDAKASCGCTVPSFSSEEIEPGASGTISVKFDSSNKSGSQSKTVTITANTENEVERLYIKGMITEDGVAEVEEVVEIVEDVYETEIEETVIESTEYDDSSYYNDDYYAEQDRKREIREAKRAEKRKEAMSSVIEKAKATLTGNYAEGSILKNSSYLKSVGTGKDEATLWVNDITAIYNDAIPSYFGSGYYGSNPYEMFNFERLYGGMSLTSKLNFDDTNASIKTSYTMNDEMAQYHKDMYNGKMNSNFYKYFNEDTMQGYFSVNTSTEGTLKAYPELVDAMFEGVEKEHLEDFVPIATRLVSILLDEEAIAKVVRGDMLLVMNGIENVEVTYTTYDYDENYESVEVTKTKTEPIPKFILMVTSEEKEIFNRIMRIGIKEGAVTAENGFYQVEIPDAPFKVNMLFKDNTLLISNSKADITAMSNGTYNAKVSGRHKKLISKNSGSIYVNGKTITRDIPGDMIPNAYKEKLNYISDNVEDATFKVSKMKGNVLKGEMILNTPEGKGHKNSLAYFLNMIDALID